MEDQAEYKINKKSLTEVYLELLERANKEKLTEFFFDYEGEFYKCEWKHPKWTDPRKIKFLNS